MARFSAATVKSHLAAEVESFKYPLREHCSVPYDAGAYAVTSTMILFRKAKLVAQLS